MENSRKDNLICKLKKDEHIEMLSKTIQDLYDFKNRFNRIVELNSLEYYAEDIEDEFRKCAETV